MSARNMRKIFEMNILGGRSGKIDQKRKLIRDIKATGQLFKQGLPVTGHVGKFIVDNVAQQDQIGGFQGSFELAQGLDHAGNPVGESVALVRIAVGLRGGGCVDIQTLHVDVEQATDAGEGLVDAVPDLQVAGQ